MVSLVGIEFDHLSFLLITVYYFVDITVSANDKKNESEIMAWVCMETAHGVDA